LGFYGETFCGVGFGFGVQAMGSIFAAGLLLAGWLQGPGATSFLFQSDFSHSEKEMLLFTLI